MTGRSHEVTKSRRHEGFTIVELLVVIAIIIVMLSLLTVAIASAARSSQSAQTLALMNSVKQAVIRFKTDIGYVPPVLGVDRELINPWGNDNLPGGNDDLDIDEFQEFRSVTTLPDYLIGYGNEQADGYGQPGDPAVPALGIRHPGRDGVWLATINGSGDLESRNIGAGDPFGKVFGPYLELKDQRLLASTDGSFDNDGNPRVYMPGEAGYDPEDHKVLVDYWGKPIFYYRRPWTPGALGTPYRPFDPSEPVMTLADVFVLRPFELDPGQAIDSLADGNGDTTTTRELKAAEFALFSSGPDRSFTPEVRYDDNEFNRDNIVEVGP